MSELHYWSIRKLSEKLRSGFVSTRTDLEAFGADDDVLLQVIRYTAPFDLTGNPTIVLPAGFSSTNLPMSLQLVGKHLAEDVLCAAGHAFQQMTSWHLRHPIA